MRIGIVSGASAGMGRDFALALVGRGPEELWLLGRREERLADLAAELAPAVRTRIFPGDLNEPARIREIQDALAQSGGAVCWIVAAAGEGRIGSFASGDPDRFRRMIDLNCGALTALISVALPYTETGAHILTLASAAAFLPQPGFAVYAATKAYVLHFSRALGRELAPRGIRVTAVCPGPVRTEFTERAERDGEKMPARKKKYATDSNHVVKIALRAAERGRAVCTPTVAMKAARLAAKCLPHGFLMRFFPTKEEK